MQEKIAHWAIKILLGISCLLWQNGHSDETQEVAMSKCTRTPQEVKSQPQNDDNQEIDGCQDGTCKGSDENTPDWDDDMDDESKNTPLMYLNDPENP